MRRTLVLLADGQSVYRAAVGAVLEREADFTVVSAGTLGEVESALADRRIDVALVDRGLPPAGGLAAVRRIRDAGVSHVVVWSLGPTPRDVFDAISAGATGYLGKHISADGLVGSLRGLDRGETVLARDLTAMLVQAVQEEARRRDSTHRAAQLSTREREVLEYLARGARNRQIAEALAISEFTVKRHVQNILRKLDLSSRRAAAVYALSGAGEQA